MHTTTANAITTTPTRPAVRWASPAVDVLSSDTAWRIVADVPGASLETLEVRLEGHRLLVEAPRSDGTGWRRAFDLPRSADGGGIEARLTHGVLTVEIPVAESARPRSIPVAR